MKKALLAMTLALMTTMGSCAVVVTTSGDGGTKTIKPDGNGLT